jgi:acyl carrier protein
MITKHDALRLIEEMLDMRAGILTGSERLKDLEAWDSLSTLVFIAAVDKRFGVPLPGHRVAQCQTVDDLCGLLTDATNRAA